MRTGAEQARTRPGECNYVPDTFPVGTPDTRTASRRDPMK